MAGYPVLSTGEGRLESKPTSGIGIALADQRWPSFASGPVVAQSSPRVVPGEPRVRPPLGPPQQHPLPSPPRAEHFLSCRVRTLR